MKTNFTPDEIRDMDTLVENAIHDQYIVPLRFLNENDEGHYLTEDVIRYMAEKMPVDDDRYLNISIRDIINETYHWSSQFCLYMTRFGKEHEEYMEDSVRERIKERLLSYADGRSLVTNIGPSCTGFSWVTEHVR